VQNFALIGQILAEIWPFFDFQDGGCCHLGFSECENFRGAKAQDGQNASPCHISRRSVEPLLLLRYDHVSIFTARAMLALQALY